MEKSAFTLIVSLLLILADCRSTEDSTGVIENGEVAISYLFEEDRSGYSFSGKITVVASDFSDPIAFNIVEKGYQNGTVSDKDGNFRLQLKSKAAPIEISFIGFKTVVIEAPYTK